MARRLFGTDGIRGVANQTLTPQLALTLGQAVGVWLRSHGEVHRVCLGRDTRRSGPLLECALAAGLCSEGVDVVRLGVAPTPTVAYVARTGEFDLGGIISASHNPAPDNGIKFVTHAGSKTSDEVEECFEGLMDARAWNRPAGGAVGDIEDDASAIHRYMAMLESIVPERLDGLRIAVDAANGAAFSLGPEILRRLGADVVSTGVSPDGMNINAEGGATKPGVIQDFTVRTGSAIGVAFDGDADRAVFSDERGTLINGDRTIGIWAAHRQSHGSLNPPTVVGTVMSNGGYEAYLASKGIHLERAPVGDKHVSRRIEETNAPIGGEQSGHIVFPIHGPTGDGLVTMLELLRVIKLEGRPASSFTGEFEAWPQLLVNVGVSGVSGWQEDPLVSRAIAEGEARIVGHGRIVVRASGTQPMVRVMVEADEVDLRDSVADAIVSAMERALNGKVHGRVDLTHALGD